MPNVAAFTRARHRAVHRLRWRIMRVLDGTFRGGPGHLGRELAGAARQFRRFIQDQSLPEHRPESDSPGSRGPIRMGEARVVRVARDATDADVRRACELDRLSRGS